MNKYIKIKEKISELRKKLTDYDNEISNLTKECNKEIYSAEKRLLDYSFLLKHATVDKGYEFHWDSIENKSEWERREDKYHDEVILLEEELEIKKTKINQAKFKTLKELRYFEEMNRSINEILKENKAMNMGEKEEGELKVRPVSDWDLNRGNRD